MIQYKLYFVGLQLLLLAYTAHSFVMLTANMEDIKKIARQFVSDSLADKIANFFVRATKQMSNQVVVNLSNERDIALQDISDDNNNYKQRIAQEKKREGKDARLIQTEKDYNEYNNKYNNDNADIQKESYSNDVLKTENKEIKRHPYMMPDNKEDNSNSQDTDRQNENNEESKETKSEEHQMKKHNRFSNQDQRVQNNNDEDIQRPSSHKKTPQKDNEDRPSMDYKTSDETVNPRYNKKKTHGDRQFTSGFQDASEAIAERANDPETQPILSGGLRAGVEFTTEKEKNEFDQYDNRNYPKALYAGTSGPVKLPRMQ